MAVAAAGSDEQHADGNRQRTAAGSFHLIRTSDPGLWGLEAAATFLGSCHLSQTCLEAVLEVGACLSGTAPGDKDGQTLALNIFLPS